jgi:hypothetical protein
MWANVYTRGKFKLSAFIKDRDYVIYKLNSSSINDVIMEDFREEQTMQNVYTIFYLVLTPLGLMKVYHILSVRVCVYILVYANP